MSESTGVLVVGDGVERFVAALERRGVPADATAPAAVGERLTADPPDCAVCVGGGEWSTLAVLAAVREHRGSLPALVVDPEGDVTGESTRVVDDATPSAVADAVAAFVPPGARRETCDGGTMLETGPRGEQLRRLLEATRALLAADDVESVCEVAVEAGRDVLGLPAVGIYLQPPLPGIDIGASSGDDGAGEDEGKERLVPVEVSKTARTLADGDVPTYTPADSLVWDVHESGDPAVVDDTGSLERESPAGSAIVLPVGDHGVFISSSPEPEAFDDVAVDLARLLAASTAAALDDAEHRRVLRARERDLRAERDRLSALFENVPVPAVQVDHRDGEPIVLAVNAAFEDVFGYGGGELVGENIDDYVIPDQVPGEPASVADEAATGGALTRRVRRRTAGGLREFLLTIAPVERGETDGLAYGFYIDVTERERRQQRLRVLSRVLRHDLRNQVTLVCGAAEQVADRATDPDIERSATEIAAAADELAALGRKTRVAERALVEEGGGEASTLGRVVEGVVAPVRNDARDARVTAHVPRDVLVPSAEAVALALRELVENALVHNDDPEPRVWLHGWTTDGGFLVVHVADDGPGIPEEERAVLAGDREVTQLEHASGLGLWMARWVVGSLGGGFAIDSGAGEGTVVELRVPLATD